MPKLTPNFCPQCGEDLRELPDDEMHCASEDCPAEFLPRVNSLVPDEPHRLRTRDGRAHIPSDIIHFREQAQLEEGLKLDDAVTTELRPRKQHQKAKLRFTDDRKVQFLALLAEYGIKSKVCRAMNISTFVIYEHAKKDPEFAEAMERAMEYFTGQVEEAIFDRAVHGWEEPVFSQKLGRQIGTIRKFDNRLLELLAKRLMPAYREKQQVEHNVSGGVLLVPDRPREQDWSEKHGGRQLEVVDVQEPGD